MGRIATFTDVQAEGVSSPPLHAELIEQKIIEAEELIESLTGRLFWPRESLTLAVTGNGKESLPLPHPALSISALTVDGVALAAENFAITVPLVGESHLFDPQIRRLDGNVWPSGSAIAITGTWGHCLQVSASPGVYRAPAMIKRAVVRLTIHWLKPQSETVSQSGRGEIVREKLGPAEFEYAQGTSSQTGWLGDDELRSIINRYRRLRIGSA